MKNTHRRLPLKTADLILIGGLLVVAAVLALVLWHRSPTGGTVEVQSQLGKGSVFTLRLPIASNG